MPKASFPLGYKLILCQASSPSRGKKNLRSCSNYSTSTRNACEHHAINWNHWLAAYVVPWGRAQIRSIFSLISSLKSPTHKCWLFDLQPDLLWWSYWLDSGFNWRHIGPLVSNSACARMLVPKLAELFAMVTGFMCIGPVMCQVSLSIISTPKNSLQLSSQPKFDARTGPITILWSTQIIKWLKRW